MIKANELRLGNWFINNYDRGNNRSRIEQMDEDWLEVLMGTRYYEDLEPIPLTPEVFYFFDKPSESIYFLGNHIWVQYSGELFFFYYGTKGKLKSISTVHELQNLYFALTGSELTIQPVDQSTLK